MNRMIIRSNSEEGKAAMIYFNGILSEYVSTRPSIPLEEGEISLLFKKHMKCDYIPGYYVFDSEKDYIWFVMKFNCLPES